MELYEQLFPAEIHEVNRIFRHLKEQLIMVETSESSISDLTAKRLLNEQNATIMLVVNAKPDEVQVCCYSETNEIRALEYMEYLFEQYGIINGNAKFAKGTMSAVLLHVSMSELEMTDVMEYFMTKADSYFHTCVSIYAETFEQSNIERVSSMQTYHKKQVTWAYVRTMDIASPGEKICLKTLENDTGVTIEARDDIYIMIGCLGEVYEISSEKFNNSYEKSEEPLDIFTKLLDFIPSVELPQQNLYLPIDELAHLCYPKPGSGILAEKLIVRTKVFGKSGRDYFVGNPGDYLAIRCDDHKDIYIIKKEVFYRTYEPSDK